MPVSIRTDERVLLVGKTGSGKTFALRRLCAHVKRLVLIDSKSTLDAWSTEPATPGAWSRLKAGQPARIRVQYEDDETYTAAIERAMGAGQCVIAVDEFLAVVPPGTRAPVALTAAYTRGREFGVSVWACSQRPAWMPLFGISESDHFFVFRLNLEQDRKRMAAFCGPAVETVIDDPHGYWYTRNGDNPVYFREWSIQARQKKGTQ